ncbi:MAG: hypothetical protein ACYSUI_23430 [Planctomycetota bacterium]|jgi:hypothetical protein
MGFVFVGPTLMGDTAGGRSFYDFKEGLKAGGWTVLSSGDGLALFSAVGDIITVRGTGAGGVNVLAWVRMQSHSGFEISLQQGNGDIAGSALTNGIRMKLSASAGFTGGTPSASQVPSAADEFVIRGGGSDAVPAQGVNWNNETNLSLDTAGEHLMIGVVEDQSPSRFVFVCLQDFSPFGCRSGYLFDSLQLQQIPLNGLTDAEPYVFYVGGTFTSAAPDTAYGQSELVGPASSGRSPFAVLGTGSWAAIEIEPFMTFTNFSDIGANNPFLAGAHDLTPLTVSRTSGTAGSNTKGVHSLIRYIAQAETTAVRNQLYTVDNKIRSWIRANACAIPWNGTSLSASWTDQREAVLWDSVGDIRVGGGRDVDRFRMRAFDTTLARIVYWDSQAPDPGGDRYTGPGPLTGVTLSLKVRRT